jgi:hypothetical protein
MMFTKTISAFVIMCFLLAFSSMTSADSFTERRIKDAHNLHATLMSRATSFRESARHNLAQGIMTQLTARSPHRAPPANNQREAEGLMNGGLGGLTGGSGLGGVTSGLTSGGASGLRGGGVGGLSCGWGGLTSGSSGSSSSSATGVYVKVTLRDNLDCSQDVILEVMLGINICLTLDVATNGAKSMMYSYNSLLISEVMYSDTQCKNMMGSAPIGVVASLLDTCTSGVQVEVQSTPFAPPKGVSGELICEYVTQEDCGKGKPFQGLWVATSHVGDLLSIGLDESLTSLSLYLGNAQVCVNTNVDAVVLVGDLLNSVVDVNANVYLSIQTTN